MTMRSKGLVVLAVLMAAAGGFVLGAAEGELPFSKDDIAGAEKLIALEFTDAERDSMQSDLADYRQGYEALRGLAIANGVPPALCSIPRRVGARPRRGAESPEAAWSGARRARSNAPRIWRRSHTGRCAISPNFCGRSR
jgi:hypothetical protein